VNRRFIGVLALLLIAATLYSQTRPRESLRGLNGMYVYVHPLGKDVEAGGLSTSQVRRWSKRSYARVAYLCRVSLSRPTVPPT